jgi:uncharacterized membrane protein
MNTTLTRRWGGAATATLLCSLLLAVALAPALVPPQWRMLPMAAFHTLCHQLPDRSPHLDGVQLAACWRCTGFFAGLIVGALLLPLTGRLDARLNAGAKWWLVGALGLMALDWAGPVVGYWDNTWTSRAATGGLLGAVAGYLFARALAVALHSPTTGETSAVPAALGPPDA